VKLGVVGSRRRNDPVDKLLVRKWIKELKPDFLVSGGCPKGADRFAEEIAKELSIPIIIFKADWSGYGKIAGFIRNTDIAKESDMLLACVSDDRKGGTEDTIKKFEKLKSPKNIKII